MSDDEIVKYCEKLVIANLRQYADSQNGDFILKEIICLQSDENNEQLLEHCNGLKNLLEKCIDILESRNERL